MITLVMRTRDWLRQADKDLHHSEMSLESQDYEWACFSAHQAAEKAVKALLQSQHTDAWGHTVSKLILLSKEPQQLPNGLLDKCKRLDRHYIPSRYPNAHDSGAPMDFYTEDDARDAIETARAIINYCKDQIPTDQLP
ncbi:MAG: HEPN domain-containing protein [Candidatus Thorarchaeota archaeon]